MTGEQPTVVVLRALGLGDFLTAVPALRGLAVAFPDHRKVLASPMVLAPLAALSGAVDEVVDASAPPAPIDPSLARPDVAVNLHGRGPSSHATLLGLQPGRLIAFSHPDVRETEGFPAWRSSEHEVARWCRLLHEFGIPADPSALDLERPPVAAPSQAVGATVLHPGAKDPTRRWPIDRWVEVAKAVSSSGSRVVVTGSPDETRLAKDICQEAGLDESAVLAGRTDLLELAAVVADARVLVSNDTGVAHLATAFRTPSVVLFGEVSPAEWGPPPDRPIHRPIWKGPRAGARSADLLALIDVEEVLEAIWGVAPTGASGEIGGLHDGVAGTVLASARGEGEKAR
ncbi:MAG TPA: glycosyltransferase family 9 protein [Actinomycetota bacterium]|nr:glycosyltransferase family 9 protein [Actinomycetota bacterium]